MDLSGINIVAGSISLGIYVGATFFAGISILASYTERSGRVTGFEHGCAYLLGSRDWVSVAFFTEILFNIDPGLNFAVAFVPDIMFLVLLIFLKAVKFNAMNDLEYEKSNALILADTFVLLRLKQFWGLVLFACGVSMYTVYDQQLPIYFAFLFSDAKQSNTMFSFLNSFQVFLEAVAMLLALFIVKRIGSKNGLLLSGFIMALRISGTEIAHNAVMISLVKLFHTVKLPILLIALFKYITNVFDKRLSSTTYLVGFQFLSSICATILSPLVGHSYDINRLRRYLYSCRIGFRPALLSGDLLCPEKTQPIFRKIINNRGVE